MKKLRKADEPPSPEEMFDAIWGEIEDDFGELNPDAEEAIKAAIKEGIKDGILQLDLDDEDLIAKMNSIASEWAEGRAAQLVGKKINARGKLVDNPRAQFAIDDATRDELKTIIADSFKQETPYSDLVDQIEDAGAFSSVRADLIARTEVANAQIKGNFDVWKQSGLVAKVTWLANDDPCDECADNDGEEREIGKPFPSGDITPLVHPRCECLLIASEIDSGDDE